MSDIYKDGIEVICPAVYIAESAAEALEFISQEIFEASNNAYDIYGNGIEISGEEFIDYLLEVAE